MARTAITVTEVSTVSAANPLAFDTGDSTNDMEFINDGKTWLLIDNDTGGAAVITIPVAAASEDVGFSDTSYTISAGDFVAIPPFEVSNYNQSGGVVHVNMDANVKIIAVRQEK